jgi:hypothetical protein
VNEKQLTESMTAAVRGEPPLGFDPDDVVDRAIRRRRRNVLSATCATAAALVAVTAVAVGGGTTSEGLQPGASPPPSPPPSSAGSLEPRMSPDVEPCPVSLGETMPPLLAEHFPDVVFTPTPEVDNPHEQMNPVANDIEHTVSVFCTAGPDTTDFSQIARVVRDEPQPGGARLRTFVEDPDPDDNRAACAGEWTSEELTVRVVVTGIGELVGTPDQAAALATDLAQLAG